MNAEMRKNLLSASTTGENSAAKGVTGKLRDLFERFLEPENGSLPNDLITGMDYAYSGGDFGTLSVAAAGLWSMNRYKAAVKEGRAPEEDWDELEKSVVAKLADEIRIGIAGQNVEMVISKKF
jgi:VCBS repeat-containing protein